MSDDLYKKAFFAVYTDLFFAVLERIKYENDFAAHQKFLEQKRFEAEKQFQTEQGFREAKLFRVD
jgi:hypothetical protein